MCFLTLVGAISKTNDAFDLWGRLSEMRSYVIVKIIAGTTPRPDVDELVIRISNPTNRQESLTEPTFECETSEGTKHFISVWNDVFVAITSPTLPTNKLFPINLAAGNTVEATLFIRKILGFRGIRDCRKLRFSWIDGAQNRKFGDSLSLPPNTSTFGIGGLRGR